MTALYTLTDVAIVTGLGIVAGVVGGLAILGVRRLASGRRGAWRRSDGRRYVAQDRPGGTP